MEDQETMVGLSQVLKDMLNAQFSTSHGSISPDDRAYFCVDCKGRSLTKSEMERCRGHEHRVLKALKCSWNYGYRHDEIKEMMKDIVDVEGVCLYSVNGKNICFPKRRDKKSSDGTKKSGSKSATCVNCGDILKPNATSKDGLFCSILCKLICPAVRVQQRRLDDQNQAVLPLVANEKDTKKSKNKNKIKKDLTEEGGPIKVKSFCGGGIRALEESEKKRKVMNEDDDDEKKSKDKRQKKSDANSEDTFETLVSTATAEVDGKKLSNNGCSFRKRSRKGIPCRAPFF